jgi:hypothetical protein
MSISSRFVHTWIMLTLTVDKEQFNALFPTQVKACAPYSLLMEMGPRGVMVRSIACLSAGNETVVFRFSVAVTRDDLGLDSFWQPQVVDGIGDDK